MPIFDLRCPVCQFRLFDEYVGQDEDMPCPGCGATMERLLTPGNVADGSWKPVVLNADVTLETRQDWDNYKARLSRQFPGRTFDIEGNDRARASQHADEVRHAAWERRRGR